MKQNLLRILIASLFLLSSTLLTVPVNAQDSSSGSAQAGDEAKVITVAGKEFTEQLLLGKMEGS